MEVVKTGCTPDQLLSGERPIGLLGILYDENVIRNCKDIERVKVQKGEILIQQDDSATDVYIVIKGKLEAVMPFQNGRQVKAGEIRPGEPAGEMQIFTGGKRTIRVDAIQDTDLIKLSKSTFETLAVESPRFVRRMAAISRRRLRKNQVIIILSKFLGPLDDVDMDFIQANTSWVYLKRGEALFRQNDPGDSLCVLINGRLVAVCEGDDGKERVVGEITQGELVGEMSVLTGNPRSASVYATRDSVLALFSNETIQNLINRYPQVMMFTTRTIINRLTKTMRRSSDSYLIKSIAVVPADPGVHLNDFVERLEKAISQFTPTLHLNSRQLDSLIGIQGISQTTESSPYDNRLSTALDEQSTKEHLIIYQCDNNVTPWTKRCIRQADKIMIVANAGDDPEQGEIEKAFLSFESSITAASQILVLIHTDSTSLPANTDRWLSKRNLEGHFHIRQKKDEDFQRLARILTGNAVGLVLGGGGARGFAHVGVIRALQEEGVPIDMIGGCSMGALIGIQPAMGWNFEKIVEINNKFFVDSKPISDYTFPALSIVRGKKMENFLKLGYGDKQIEDSWITFFCVSSNLSTAETVVHRRGDVWKAVRTSLSIPGMLAPVLHGNDLLADGCLLNNLPGDIMAEICKGRVIAVDVSVKTDFKIQRDRIPSAWDVIRNRIFPSKQAEHLPSIMDIMTRSTLLASASKTDEVKSGVDFYLQPPVEKVGLLDFSAFHEIVDIGYHYAKQEIPKWKWEA